METPYQARWSPIDWDPTHRLDAATTDLLLEAARWSPSAGNSQPWSFVTALRGDALHTALLPTLAASARRWAPAASLLVVNVCHRYVEGTDWDYSEFAEYDLGQAVAHLTLQAHALGLHSRQFRAFDRSQVEAVLDVPPHWVAMTMTAVGRPAPGAQPSDRLRRPLDDLRLRPAADGGDRAG
jgi:nitroreductase